MTLPVLPIHADPTTPARARIVALVDECGGDIAEVWRRLGYDPEEEIALPAGREGESDVR